MTFEQACPKCGATFQLPAELAGKSLCCQECKHVFVGAPTKKVEAKTNVPPRLPKSAKPKRPATTPNASSGFGWLTIVGGVVIVGFGMTCGVSLVVLAANFLPIQQLPPIASKDDKQEVKKNDDAPIEKKDDKLPVAPAASPLALDKFGRASFRADLGKGELSYRVPLQKGATYNVFAHSAEVDPSLKVSHNDRTIQSKQGKRTAFLSLTAEQTAEHIVNISARPQQAGSVEIQFAPAESRPPLTIDVSRTSQGYSTKDKLLISNEVSPKWPSAPHRAFRMSAKAGTEYEFKATSKDFSPVLRVLQGDAIFGDWVANGETRSIDARLKADITGDVIVLLSSDGGLGEFTLNIRAVPDRPPVQNVGHKVDFNGDMFQQITLMAKEAVRDEEGTPYVVYDVPMEAGWAYSVDHKHSTGHVGLSLFGPDGKQVTNVTRFVGAHHARLLHDAKVNGSYPLHVSVKDAGPVNYTLEITRIKLPSPVQVNGRFPYSIKKGPDFLSVEAEMVKGFIQTSSCAWTRDGKAFIVMDETGWLHRFLVPPFLEDKKVFLDKDGIHNIHMTAEGILVPRPRHKEFWLIDPNSLHVIRRIPSFSTSGAILTGPDLSVAYTQIAGKLDDGPAKKGLATHDLTGKVPLQAVLSNRLNGLLAISNDGKSIFARTDDGRLGRFHADGKNFEIEHAGDFYGPLPSANTLTVSSDGKWLFRTIMPVKAQRDETTAIPPTGYGVLAYSVNDLRKTAFTIDTGSTAYHVATDPRSNKILMYSDARGLLVADPTGKVDEFPLPITDKIKDRVRRIVMHPNGGKFVAILGSTVSRIIYVEWDNAIPIAKAPIKAPVPKAGAFLRNFEAEPQRVGDLSVQKIAHAVYWNTPGWSVDGKSFYVVQAQNVIYDVDAKDFNIRQSKFFTPFTWVRGGACMSAEGLLSLGCGEKNQGADMDLILLEPKSLQTIKRVRCANSSHVVCSPNLSVAFVGGKNPFTQSPNQPELLIVDLKEGKAVKPDVQFPLSPQTFQVSPDGKYFYGTDGRSIARFRIDGTKLIHEETSKPIAQEEKVMPRLEISVDGTKVWLVGQAPAAQKDALGLHMLDALDFTQPAREIKERVYSANIDPVTKALVLAKHDQALDFVRADQPAPMGGDWKCDTPRQIIMHPRGGELFMICNSTLYHVSWNDKK